MESLRSRLTSRISHLTSFVGVAASLALSSPAGGQYLTRPQIPWRTITTARFDIHYPAEMADWTRVVAQRMESMADAVNAVVGNAPTSRVTVIVEDPSNIANGFALPFIESPVIFLWPTPPFPSPTFGSHRGWGEVLAIHEYGHIAHLTFPSRNPRDRRLWRWLPVQIGPVTRKAPAWVIEGYATLIEGRLTGSGRPHSAGRASVLRQWALEGRFPTYFQLNGSAAFLGGNMRYLAGSAFLEWLQQRKGDSSLVHLWRRMSARQDRSFEAAFAGVFGASPADLYGAFTVDVMERSLLVRTRLREAGLVEGELIQRLTGGTGEPAVSPDGRRVAVVLRSLTGPSRLVVWSTTPEPDSALRRARERMLRLDPRDVAPFDSFPPTRRALATLRPSNGRSHEFPRWMPDGVNILVTRDEPAPNGVTRPDLFQWNTRTGSVRRITRGAGVRQADPSPDGHEAVGIRCHAGSCSVVVITLSTGEWRVLAAGTPELVWHRPRYSPDGTQVAASLQDNGRWGVAVIETRSGAVRRLTTEDGASRYAPSFTPSGRELVAVSERGGIANLEIVPFDGSPPRALTRLTGAAVGPDVSRADSSIWFLALRTGGYDVRRLRSLSAVAGDVVTISGQLAPAAPPTASLAGFPVNGGRDSIDAREYGLGPRRWRLLPGGTAGPDGHTTTLMLSNIDPIGRLSVITQGAYGSRGTWRGGSVSAALRQMRVGLDASAWYVEHEPSKARDHLAGVASDVRFTGAGLQARLTSERSNMSYSARVLFSAGQVKNDLLVDANRVSTAVEGRARVTKSLAGFTFTSLAGVVVDIGQTNGESWRRTISSGSLIAGTSRHQLRGDALTARVTSASTGQSGLEMEQVVVGGAPNPLIDPLFLSQRIALAAVPAGFVTGPGVEMFRASLAGMAFEPFFTTVRSRGSLNEVKRIAGVERSFAISSLGFARLPAVRARAGASWSFDEPYRRRARVYASLVYSP